LHEVQFTSPISLFQTPLRFLNMNDVFFRGFGKPPGVFAAALTVLAALAGGCTQCPKDQPTEQASSAPAAADKEADSAADEPAAASTPELVASADLPDHPERIVSLAPNVTEIIFALGEDERLVGVTRYCDYPKAAAELPRVGGVVDTDFEAILALEPDLVVGVTSGADAKIAPKLDRAQLNYAFVRMDDLEETYAGIRQIGHWIDAPSRAGEVAKTMRERIDGIAEGAPETGRPSVLLVYGRDPLVVAGPGTFGHQLIGLAGGQNAVADANTAYPKLDIEKVIDLDPDRIIDASSGARAGEDGFWEPYAALGAVQAGHVHLFRDDVALRPAPRLAEGLAKMQRAIDPGEDDP
jgi:iron complex transport system substrate-binding protein